MPTIKLTAKKAESITATGKRTEYRDTTVTGLVLTVSADGSSKVLRYEYKLRDGRRGKVTLGSLERISVEQAKVEARKLAGRIANGEHPAAKKRRHRLSQALAKSRTLRSFINGKYWEDILSHNRSGDADRKRILAAWSELAETDLVALKTEAIQQACNTRSGRVSASTLSRDCRALNAALNRAVALGLVSENPLNGLKRPRKVDDARVRYLGQFDDLERHARGERDRLLEALEQSPPHLRAMTLLAMNTGLRRGEIFKLMWRAVDLARQLLTVEADTSKSGKARTVGLNRVAANALVDWREKQGRTGVSDVAQHVFLNPKTGRPFTSIKTAWSALVQRAQLEDFRFHDCRHDCASRLVMAGVPLIRVRDILGHSTITLTERYAHLAPNDATDMERIA
jgi:integrase